MLWKHKITGAEINVGSTMSGDWEPAEAPGNSAHAADQKAEKTAAKKAVNNSGRTVRKQK